MFIPLISRSTDRDRCQISLLNWITMLLSLSCHDKLLISPANTILPMHYPAQSAQDIGLQNYSNAQQDKRLVIINIPNHVQNNTKDTSCTYSISCGVHVTHNPSLGHWVCYMLPQYQWAAQVQGVGVCLSGECRGHCLSGECPSFTGRVKAVYYFAHQI